MIVELKGGPMDGVVHEVEHGRKLPDSIGIYGVDGTHWYDVHTKRRVHAGTYSHTHLLPQKGPSSVNNITAASRHIRDELDELSKPERFTCPNCGEVCCSWERAPGSNEGIFCGTGMRWGRIDE